MRTFFFDDNHNHNHNYTDDDEKPSVNCCYLPLIFKGKSFWMGFFIFRRGYQLKAWLYVSFINGVSRESPWEVVNGAAIARDFLRLTWNWGHCLSDISLLH